MAHTAPSRKFGFTLAEVLITLGIIGVVAALTMPVISQNVQKIVLKNQFKRAYAEFSNGVFLAQANLGQPVGCFYWTTGQLCKEICTSRDEYGDCKSSTCSDGSPLPANQNGLRGDCAAFEEELFNNVFKVIKFCEKNALANGCLTDKYRGTDKIKKENNPDNEYSPNKDFSDNNIKNAYSAWLLNDGLLIIKYGTYKSNIPIYTIDINGHKGPNKWGYDIFTFGLQGDNDGIKKFGSYVYATEKGGKTAAEMLKDF